MTNKNNFYFSKFLIIISRLLDEIYRLKVLNQKCVLKTGILIPTPLIARRSLAKNRFYLFHQHFKMFLVPHKKWILSSYWPWCNGSKWCWWKGSIKLMLLANANFIRKNIFFQICYLIFSQFTVPITALVGLTVAIQTLMKKVLIWGQRNEQENKKWVYIESYILIINQYIPHI